MSFDFSTLFWVLLAVVALQPLLMGRWFSLKRVASHSRHREGQRLARHNHDLPAGEGRSLLGFPVSRFINLEDAQTIIAAIKETPTDRPIDFIVHTAGLVLAAMQIARAIEAHPAKVRVMVPVYAMSGGTLIALAGDEIVMDEFSVLGPIDPQLAGFPAASIVRARDSKPIHEVHDLTLVMADMSESSRASQARRHRAHPQAPRRRARRSARGKAGWRPMDTRLRTDV